MSVSGMRAQIVKMRMTMYFIHSIVEGDIVRNRDTDSEDDDCVY